MVFDLSIAKRSAGTPEPRQLLKQAKFVQSLDGPFRVEGAHAPWFANLNESKSLIEVWRREFTESRPHLSLG